MFPCLVMCFSRVIVYYLVCSRQSSLQVISKDVYGLENSRVWRKGKFFEHSIDRQRAKASSIVSRHLPDEHCDGRILFTELIKYWRKACVLACLNHTVPLL
jgi:hypothetical protein